MVLLCMLFLQLCSVKNVRNRGQNLLMESPDPATVSVNFAVLFGVIFYWKEQLMYTVGK